MLLSCFMGSHCRDTGFVWVQENYRTYLIRKTMELKQSWRSFLITKSHQNLEKLNQNLVNGKLLLWFNRIFQSLNCKPVVLCHRNTSYITTNICNVCKWYIIYLFILRWNVCHVFIDATFCNFAHFNPRFSKWTKWQVVKVGCPPSSFIFHCMI